MDIETKEHAINTFVMDSFLELNRVFSHALYERIDYYYPDQPINPKGFETTLYLAWLGYSRLN